MGLTGCILTGWITPGSTRNEVGACKRASFTAEGIKVRIAQQAGMVAS